MGGTHAPCPVQRSRVLYYMGIPIIIYCIIAGKNNNIVVFDSEYPRANYILYYMHTDAGRVPPPDRVHIILYARNNY